MLLAGSLLLAQLSEETQLFQREHATDLQFDPRAMACHRCLRVGQLLNARFDLVFVQLIGVDGFIERALCLTQASGNELAVAVVASPYFADLLPLFGRQVQ